jgi:hypothetical protein
MRETGHRRSVLPSDTAIYWEKRVTKRVTALLRRRGTTGVFLSSLRPPRVAMWHHLLCVKGSLPHLLECVPGTIAFSLLVNCLQNLHKSNTLREGKILGYLRESAANSRTGVDMNFIAAGQNDACLPWISSHRSSRKPVVCPEIRFVRREALLKGTFVTL